MACSCIDKIENDTLLHLTEKNPEKVYTPISKSSDTGLQNTAYFFDNGKPRLYGEVKIESKFTKVNSELSKGKFENIKISYIYCPFCGVKY